MKIVTKKQNNVADSSMKEPKMYNDVVVYSPKIARQLIKLGFNIIDIAPDKENTDKTVFFFKNEDGLLAVVNKLASKYKKNVNNNHRKDTLDNAIVENTNND